MAANVMLAGTTLTILGGANADIITVNRELLTDQLVVKDAGQEVGRFASAAITDLTISGGDGNDLIYVGPNVTQNATLNGDGNTAFFQIGGDTLVYRGSGVATINGGVGNDLLQSNSAANDTLNGGAGRDVLDGGLGQNQLTGGADPDIFLGSIGRDAITDLSPTDLDARTLPPADLINDPLLGLPPSANVTLTMSEVDTILQRATAATSSSDAIIAIVDRSGRILGVRAEDGVLAYINSLPPGTGVGQRDFFRVFAVDGAVAEARTAAFIGNNQAPLTSRTFQTTSETTLTQREIESYPSITDPNSTLRGPGFVGPLGLNDHFPRGVAFAPQVDQFAIEHTNRDSLFAVGPDNIKGTADDVQLLQRFNVNPAFIPGRILTPGATTDPFGRAQVLPPPESYGLASGLMPTAQARGLGTLPGGIPIYKKDPATGKLTQVGAIGAFFPGKTGFSDEENSTLDANYDPTKPDRSLEAEFIAFAALGGSSGSGFTFGALGGVSLPTGPDGTPNFDLPFGRIDLVGLTLDVFGPKGNNGPTILTNYGKAVGPGVVNGQLQTLLDPGLDNLYNGIGDVASATNLLNGTFVPEGYLVNPHGSADGSVTAADVQRMVFQAVQESLITRAAIRLPMDSNAVQVIAITAPDGELLGLFRMPDSTIFSLDVATAKARNAYYYASPALQPIDQLPGVPKGVAFTARTFRYLALPRFPEGNDGGPPGPFSQLQNDPGIDRSTPYFRKPVQPQDLFYDVVGTGLQVGPRQPASVFQAPLGFDSFNPGTNFHDTRNTGVIVGPGMFNNPLLNRNGALFFPGSIPIYKDLNGDGQKELIGGIGTSGDGVDQDDIITQAMGVGFEVPDALRADQFFFNGVRLPYAKFNRQPNINPYGSRILGNPLQARFLI
jgi:uncharacterized protein GlcG (DUF336 family)